MKCVRSWKGLIYIQPELATVVNHATVLSKAFMTASAVGKAGIAPLSVTVIAPQAFAKLRASLNRCSSYK